ncbi:MAG: Cu(I)/Ag(I) efflux system membrane protein CusA/SilA [Verrucomicrobiales bacterium]|jgi:Cu(I)/Ag(I) efflux system membrane protein CusA/SilA
MEDRKGVIQKGIEGLIRFTLENKIIVFLVLLIFVVWGIIVAPFDWKTGLLERDPVPVDAIPDYGENQQIIFTQWMGRSPEDVEDQITYPLTVALLGTPKVKTVRSYSFFGFSSIYVVFQDDAEWDWSRTKIIEKLNSLPAGTLPEGITPMLGPDATALGQVYWYTLEGRDGDGNPAEGLSLQELRTTQDFYVRYALQSVEGVAEVASIGGFVKEYQIDVDPDAMRAHGVTLEMVFKSVKMSNLDVGARTIEINKAEYVIRGLGFIENLDDLRQTVVKASDNVPITLDQIAEVELGPALRRGALDKEGAEAVGGVVVVRYGANPLDVIKRVKEKIAEISPGLPQMELSDGRISKVTIEPFYDRTGLIHETLGTLNTALSEEILVTIMVVLLIVLHLRSSLLISMMLPMAILITFIAMKMFKVDANIVALSGIAIAIGTIVDMGIVICENILKHLDEAEPGEDRLEVIFRASSEVGSAVLTAVLTTIVSFLPVFAMIGAEGKLFQPLAYTKTFALTASIIIALTLIPPLAHLLFRDERKRTAWTWVVQIGLAVVAFGLALFTNWFPWWAVLVVALISGYRLAQKNIPEAWANRASAIIGVVVAFVFAVVLANSWLPLGPEKGLLNLIFVILIVGGLLGLCLLFIHFYPRMLGWFLRHKIVLTSTVGLVIFTGVLIWLGVGRVFAFVPEWARKNVVWSSAFHTFPGLGSEFMPSLDEGSFLFMPTTMPHASIGEAMDVMKIQDQSIRSIPEVESVVGKLGRVESPLDPAPVSMFEAIILYKPEYVSDKQGHRLRFKYDREKGEYPRDAAGELIPDKRGRVFRQWRDHIQSPDDIWKEVIAVTAIPGTTSAPKLQPIAARLVMLQSGMRAPMGLKVYGPDLETIEKVGLRIEQLLKEVPAIDTPTVFADRIVGKPYLEIDIDRKAIARYGIHIKTVQDVIEVAVGGRRITTTVEGRERYPVRVRYQRELRDSIESLGGVLIPAPDGTQIPLGQLSEIIYKRGPQVIKSEKTFLVGYVIFDKKPDFAEVDVVDAARDWLKEKEKDGTLDLAGCHYEFTGNYENQVRAAKKLFQVIPLALLIIFIIIYLQFKKVTTTLLVFSGILMAWSGGFILLWLYSQGWFLDISIFGTSMRDLFQVHTINLSVAVWVGFLALFGIATDDGVLMGTYLEQRFKESKPTTRDEIRQATIEAATRRNRAAMMTTATTLLALLPVLTSTGRGSDVMVPMAIPTFGGMTIAILTVFVVPTFYCWIEEMKARNAGTITS